MAKQKIAIGLLCFAVFFTLIAFSVATPWQRRVAADIDRSTAASDVSWRKKIDPRRWVEKNGKAFVALETGAHAELTIDVGLQRHVERVLKRHAVPVGALVALNPKDGRVLAFASRGSIGGNDVARDPTSPAASVYKIITASALIDQGVHARKKVCYGGGARRLTEADLVDNQKRDTSCATLADAMGFSINAIFAKLADRYLNRKIMQRYVDAYAFGQRLPFDLALAPSAADVPSQRLERSRTAAGFWHTYMSPVHGALIAATIANDGAMPRAGVVERLVDAKGTVIRRYTPGRFRQVITAPTAAEVGLMMQRTVTRGTAKRAFYDGKGRPFVPGVSIAAKTGSLSRSNPHRGYTWWVGFAPAEKPTIALAALIVNDPVWQIKASYLAREAMRYHFKNAQ